MTFRDTLSRTAMNLLVERPARRRTFADFAAALSTTAGEIEQRIATAPDTPANREQARHLIGMERWGQRRLRVALGEPPVQDEYDGYRPADLPLADLRAVFQDTRRDTIALVHDLERAGVSGDTEVPHNQFGPLTRRGWLRYLGMHAWGESKRIK